MDCVSHCISCRIGSSDSVALCDTAERRCMMRTFRCKGTVPFDVEVIADTEADALDLAKKQTEQTLYNTDVNFYDVKMTRAIDSKTANRVKRI